MLHGENFEGGHEENRGLSPAGAPIAAPLHRHLVSLDYTRAELGLTYGWKHDWELSLRIPWERKAQRAGIELTAPATPADRESIERNAEIHHRTETYSGMADVMALARRRSFDRFLDGDALSIAFGASIPTGRTEEDPYRLGRRGKRHLHIQFGTGTVDPLLEASYLLPLGDGSQWRLHSSATARVPLYENSRGYEGPTEVSFAIGPSLRTSDSWSLRAEAEAFHQGRARWNGVPDQNTGLRSWSASITLQLRQGRSSVETTLRLPVSQSVVGEGDAFEQSATFGVFFTTIR